MPPHTKYAFDEQCHPEPGDAIVGIREPQGVVIHKRTCPMLSKYVSKKDCWLSVGWNTSNHFKNTQTVSLIITWKTGPESIENVVAVLEKAKVKILSLSVVSQGHKNTKGQAEIGVRNKDHLLDVLDALRACPKVFSVYQEKDEA